MNGLKDIVNKVMYIPHERSKEVKPLIINLLKKEGIDITVDNIKIWATSRMHYSNVKIGCDFVKSEGLPLVLVYGNEVPHKSAIEEMEGVRIFDINDLFTLSFKHNSKLLNYC